MKQKHAPCGTIIWVFPPVISGKQAMASKGAVEDGNSSVQGLFPAPVGFTDVFNLTGVSVRMYYMAGDVEGFINALVGGDEFQFRAPYVLCIALGRQTWVPPHNMGRGWQGCARCLLRQVQQQQILHSNKQAHTQ